MTFTLSNDENILNDIYKYKVHIRIPEPSRTQITWDPNAGFSESLQSGPSNGPQATFTSAAFNLTVERESEATIRLSWSHQANLKHLRHKKHWPYSVRIVPIEGG